MFGPVWYFSVSNSRYLVKNVRTEEADSESYVKYCLPHSSMYFCLHDFWSWRLWFLYSVVVSGFFFFLHGFVCLLFIPLCRFSYPHPPVVSSFYSCFIFRTPLLVLNLSLLVLFDDPLSHVRGIVKLLLK